MFVDPITVAASAPNPELKLTVINQDGFGSQRRDLNGGGYNTIINHSKLKDGERHYLQMQQTKNVTDPYTSLVRSKTASASLSVSIPLGFTAAEAAAVVKALIDTLQDSEVTIAGLLSWQS